MTEHQNSSSAPTLRAAGPQAPGRDGAALRLTGLTKTFGTGSSAVRAVRGVDLQVAPGEVVAFLGPNGAGKSTTIDMILGLSRPDSGTVTLFGGNPQDAVRAGRVGAMLQSGALLPDVSVREIVALFAALHQHPLPVDEALRRAGVSDIAAQKTQNLSGGQVQRVRFALAVVPDPDLIVLDEPTVAMDVGVRRQFWDSMREFAAGGRTVLFATHYLQEADDFADRVVVMAKGRLVADGTGAQIKASASGRTLAAVVPTASQATLRALPGVVEVDIVGPRFSLRCNDSDAALRALVQHFPDAHDIEIHQANLEEAFLDLVATQEG